MRRTALAILIVLLVSTSMTGTVLAQSSGYLTTLQVRYWSAPLTFSADGASLSDSGSGWGGTLRVDSKTAPWSISGRYDWLSTSASNLPWNTASAWDANIHYRFGPNLDSYGSVFVGYGSTSLNSNVSPLLSASTSGVRIGVDFFYRPGPFYFTGSAAYGPSWSTNISGVSGLNEWDLGIAVGYEIQRGFGAEIGWRSLKINAPSSSGLCSPFECSWGFSGLTLALSFRQ